MKLIKLLFLFCTLLLIACSNDKPRPKTHFIDVHFVIRSKGSTTGRNEWRFFLIQGVEDSTVWGEYYGLKTYGLPDSIWYNREIGDTLWFKYIRKDRFFHKTPRK